MFVPVSIVLDFVVHASPALVFVTALLGIVPLAEWIRRATEQLAATRGSAIGGLLNVSFGNAPELIIAFFVLRAGHTEVVKAQITGSIIGNSLLGLGLAVVAGSVGRDRQIFARERAGLLSSLLTLAMIALMIPALFDWTERSHLDRTQSQLLDERLSLGVSVVLVGVYVANLVYTLVTHRDVFSAPSEGEDEVPVESHWPAARSLVVLASATVVTAVLAEVISGTVEQTAAGLGLTPFFLGATVLAIVGNAAEYLSAVYFARRNRMGLVFGITVGSTIQIALLVAPLLVLVSWAFGAPMNLVFANPLELVAIASVAFIINAIAHDGETTWFEGVMLLAVYLLLCIAFFYLR